MRINIKRQFNYTDRVKIPKHAVRLRVMKLTDAPPRLIVDDFGLNQLSIPHNQDEWLGAKVILEANRHTTSSFVRIEVGSVGDVSSRSGTQFAGTLEEFDTDENIVFTVKVVSAGAGRLLAEAKNLRAGEDQAQRHELLKVQEHDLGEEPWRLKWEDGIGPIIQVNKRLIGDRDNFLTRDAYMQGTVLPTVLRMVLLRLLMDSEQRDASWGHEWLHYAAEYAPNDPPQSTEDGAVEWSDAELWVDQVLKTFSERFFFTERINEVIRVPEEE